MTQIKSATRQALWPVARRFRQDEKPPECARRDGAEDDQKLVVEKEGHESLAG
ncbi:hypothetical protein [Frigidibacter sp. SD6-1]|uniref:hypothetical protein n=1 Tax=Frigidibacter sp. SD6-1 TaxID=3032581 RepID=UPI0032E7FB69